MPDTRRYPQLPSAWSRAMACLAVACAVAAPVHAQTASTNAKTSAPDAPWQPHKTVEYIVPSGAGAALDAAARKLTELLVREGYAPSFAVTNKSTAHGIVALEGLHRHPGDAHTLMTLSTSYGSSLAQNALPAHLQKATPLATLFREFVTIVVRADSPLQNAQDLIDQLRQDPGKFSIGIAQTLGNHIHLGAAQPLKQAGVHVQDLRIIPYKSSAESMNALVGGHLDVVSATTPNLLPYLQSGRVRVLAIAAEQRLGGAFSHAPTWKEQGIDYVSDSFQGVMTVPGASPAQQAYWLHALQQVTSTPAWQDFVRLNQWEPWFNGPQATAQLLHTQVQTTHSLLNELGLLPDAPQRVAKAPAR